MGIFNKIKNMFCSDKDFFDKEATIKEYFSLVPPDKRKKVNGYEELYQEALKYVEKQDFEKNTEHLDDYFHEITPNERTIAVLLGIIAYGAAREVDKNGKSIEAAIDKMLPKDYDKNNPFDTKPGFKHRIFGHDPATFGLKNIPADLVIKVKDASSGKQIPVKIGDFLGKGTSGKVSMWDLIWKFYGNPNNIPKGIINCLSHTIVHFTKDLFTPEGLPIPFITLFNKYQKLSNGTASGISYKDSLMKKFEDNKIKMKASDFASYFLIQTFLKFYCDYEIKEKSIKDVEGFKRDMKLLAMGTCIALQMATIVIGGQLVIDKKGTKPMIPGGNVNLLMTGTFFKIAVEDLASITKARHSISQAYKTNYMEDYYNE